MTRKKSRLSKPGKRKRSLEHVKKEAEAHMDLTADPTPGGSSDAVEIGDCSKKRKNLPTPKSSSSKILPDSAKLPKGLKKKVENLIASLGSAGYDSLLVVVKVQEGPVVTEKFGSTKGRNFLKNKPQLASDFTQYCQDESTEQRTDGDTMIPDKQRPKTAPKTNHNVAPKYTSTKSKEKQFNVQSKVVGKDNKHESEQLKRQEGVIGTEQMSEEIDMLDGDSDAFDYGENNDDDDITIVLDPDSDTETETFLDFLKMKLGSEAEAKLPSDEVDKNECKQGAIDPGLDPDFVNLPKTVVRVLENIDEVKKECKVGKNGKHRCLLCDYEAVGFYVIRRHLDVHYRAMRQSLVGCDKCDAKLPESFISLHIQTHEHTWPPMLDMVHCVDRDITNDLVYLLLQEFQRARQPYQCKYCETDFGNLDMYKNHFMVQHTYKYVCKLCGKSIYSYQQMVQHVREHKDYQEDGKTSAIYPPEVVAPGIRPGATTTGGDMEARAAPDEQVRRDPCVDEERDMNNSCPYCHKNFPTQDELVDHVNDAHIDTTFIKFPCPTCKKSFISDSALQAHIRQHEQMFKCLEEGCSATFNSKWSRRVHNQQEHGKLIRQKSLCNICGQAFGGLSRLKEHIEFKHNGRQPIKCRECGNEFRSSDAYKKHIQTHTDEANFICHICGMHFKAAHQLSSHKRVHITTAAYTCKKCGAEFKRKYAFQAHLFNKKHFSPDQPEALLRSKTCPKCGKHVANGNELYKHTERAHGKPQICPYCNKQLSDKDALRVHIRTHTNEQPRCKICHALFRSKVKLTEHFETKHAGIVQLVEASTSCTMPTCLAGPGTILHSLPGMMPVAATTVEVVTDTVEPLVEGSGSGGDKAELETLAASDTLVTQDATFHQMGNIVFTL